MDATKPCGMCLTEIPAAATRCPQCGGDPRGAIEWTYVRRMGWWMLGSLGLVLVGAIITTAGRNDAGSDLPSIGNSIWALGWIAFMVCIPIIIWRLFHLPRRPAAPKAE